MLLCSEKYAPYQRNLIWDLVLMMLFSSLDAKPKIKPDATFKLNWQYCLFVPTYSTPHIHHAPWNTFPHCTEMGLAVMGWSPRCDDCRPKQPWYSLLKSPCHTSSIVKHHNYAELKIKWIVLPSYRRKIHSWTHLLLIWTPGLGTNSQRIPSSRQDRLRKVLQNVGGFWLLSC